MCAARERCEYSQINHLFMPVSISLHSSLSAKCSATQNCCAFLSCTQNICRDESSYVSGSETLEANKTLETSSNQDDGVSITGNVTKPQQPAKNCSKITERVSGIKVFWLCWCVFADFGHSNILSQSFCFACFFLPLFGSAFISQIAVKVSDAWLTLTSVSVDDCTLNKEEKVN